MEAPNIQKDIKMKDVSTSIAAMIENTKKSFAHEYSYSLPHDFHLAVSDEKNRRITIAGSHTNIQFQRHIVEVLRETYANKGIYLRVVNLNLLNSNFLAVDEHKENTLWVIDRDMFHGKVDTIMDFAEANDLMVLLFDKFKYKYTFDDPNFSPDQYAPYEVRAESQVHLTIYQEPNTYQIGRANPDFDGEVYCDLASELIVAGCPKLTGEKKTRFYICPIEQYHTSTYYQDTSSKITKVLESFFGDKKKEVNTSKLELLKAGFGRAGLPWANVEVKDLSEVISFLCYIAPHMAIATLDVLREIAKAPNGTRVEMVHCKGVLEVNTVEGLPARNSVRKELFRASEVITVTRIDGLYVISLDKCRGDISGVFVGKVFASEFSVL